MRLLLNTEARLQVKGENHVLSRAVHSLALSRLAILERFQCSVSPSVICSPGTYIDSPSVARDGDWFKEYTPFDTVIEDRDIAFPLQVIGIGTVELKTQSHPDAACEEQESILHLTNVLHAPTANCNIVGGKALSKEYRVNIDSDPHAVPRGIITRGEEPTAYFEGDCADPRIALARCLPLDDRTKSQGRRGVVVSWANKEREKWTAHQVERKATEKYACNDEGGMTSGDAADERLGQLKPSWFIPVWGSVEMAVYSNIRTETRGIVASNNQLLIWQ